MRAGGAPEGGGNRTVDRPVNPPEQREEEGGDHRRVAAVEGKEECGRGWCRSCIINSFRESLSSFTRLILGLVKDETDDRLTNRTWIALSHTGERDLQWQGILEFGDLTTTDLIDCSFAFATPLVEASPNLPQDTRLGL